MVIHQAIQDMNALPSFDPKIQLPADSYRARLGLTNFINAHAQIRDCMRFAPHKVLIIGGGAGLEAAILRSWNIEVTVMDIDPALNPDVLGSVDNLSMFADKQFDVAIVSHVLEHLPYEYFDRCLSEIARVSKHALIYLPFACLVPELRFSIEPIFVKRIRLRIPLFWKNHKFNGEHYWEIGVKGHSLSKTRQAIAQHFDIVADYHNWDWKYSYNFVVKSR